MVMGLETDLEMAVKINHTIQLFDRGAENS